MAESSDAANIRLALANLTALIDDARRLQQAAGISDEDLARWVHISENLSGKLEHGKIRKVPGLSEKHGDPERWYRHWNGEKWVESSPRAAYCDNDTQFWNGREWVSCDYGTIIVDGKLVDPTPHRPIDPRTRDGWKAKWTLLHILVHEKAHEVMIGEQLKLLKLGDWAHNGAEKAVAGGIAVEKAIRTAGDEKTHAEVYKVQKAVLALRIKLLDADIAELRRQRDAANSAAERTRLLDEINRRIDQRRWQVEWLKAEIKHLEHLMAKATGDEFPENKTLFGDLRSGTVALALVDPAGYERFDLTLRAGRVARVQLTESALYGYDTSLRPAVDLPDLFAAMPDSIYTAQLVQDDAAAVASWALVSEQITVSTEPFGPFLEAAPSPELAAAFEEVDRLSVRVHELESRLDAGTSDRGSQAPPG